mmetsp:Transcript_112913/g.158434  ORF Transcript_112913/g.158434 Transcript_112913/m.158434 type:complete len:284 (-) Transcript_112913:3363-4214(-)
MSSSSLCFSVSTCSTLAASLSIFSLRRRTSPSAFCRARCSRPRVEVASSKPVLAALSSFSRRLLVLAALASLLDWDSALECRSASSSSRPRLAISTASLSFWACSSLALSSTTCLERSDLASSARLRSSAALSPFLRASSRSLDSWLLILSKSAWASSASSTSSFKSSISISMARLPFSSLAMVRLESSWAFCSSLTFWSAKPLEVSSRCLSFSNWESSSLTWASSSSSLQTACSDWLPVAAASAALRLTSSSSFWALRFSFSARFLALCRSSTRALTSPRSD